MCCDHRVITLLVAVFVCVPLGASPLRHRTPLQSFPLSPRSSVPRLSGTGGHRICWVSPAPSLALATMLERPRGASRCGIPWRLEEDTRDVADARDTCRSPPRPSREAREGHIAPGTLSSARVSSLPLPVMPGRPPDVSRGFRILDFGRGAPQSPRDTRHTWNSPSCTYRDDPVCARHQGYPLVP